MNYSPLCLLSLFTLCWCKILCCLFLFWNKKLMCSQSSFLHVNYCKLILFKICCKQIKKTHGPFWFFHLAKRDDTMRNFTCFLFIRTLCSLIYAEAFASLQRARTTLVVRDNWDVTVQLVGPELLTQVTGTKGGELDPPAPQGLWLCLCPSAAKPAGGASTSREQRLEGISVFLS